MGHLDSNAEFIKATESRSIYLFFQNVVLHVSEYSSYLVWWGDTLRCDAHILKGVAFEDDPSFMCLSHF